MSILPSSRFIICLLIGTLLPQMGWGAFTGQYRSGQIQYSNQTHYFSSTENYGDDGTVVGLSGADSQFVHTEISNQFRYDLNFRSSVFFDVGVGNSRSVTPQNTRNRWSGTDFGIGFESKVLQGWMDLIPDLRITAPLNRVDINGDEVMTGEGALQAQVGLYVSRATPSFRLFGYLGSTLRDEGRSWLMPWMVHSSTYLGPIHVGAEVGGFMTTLQDESTNNSQLRTQASNKVNAGSLRFYAVNPSLVEARALLGLRLGPQTSLDLGYGMTLDGRRSAKGKEILLKLDIGFGGDKTPPHASEVIQTLEDESQSFGSQPTGVATPLEQAQPSQTPEAAEIRQEAEDAIVTDPNTFRPDRPADDPVFQTPKNKTTSGTKPQVKSNPPNVPVADPAKPGPQSSLKSSPSTKKKSRFKQSRERGRTSQ